MPSKQTRQRIQKSKRSIMLGVIAFFVLQWVMLGVVELRYPLIADPEYGFRLERLRKLRADHPDRPSLIVLGSSRVGNGFETDYANDQNLARDVHAPTVANFSITGGTSVWQYIVLKRLVDTGFKPDSVIVEILPPSLLGDKQYFMNEYHFPVHRLRYSDCSTLRSLMPAQAARHTSEWLLNNAIFPWHTHRFSLIGLNAPKWQVELNSPNSRPEIWRTILSSTGWIAFGVAEPTAQQRVEAEALAKQTYHAAAKDLSVSEESRNCYREMFRYCQEQNIRVEAVVLMPESDEFRSWYPPPALDAIQKFTQAITDEFGIHVVDARRWIQNDLFWDGHHLLERGARVFTAKLQSEIVR